MAKLAEYPEMLAKAADELGPHQVAFYLRELAGELHSYYNAERVLVDDEAQAVAAARQYLSFFQGPAQAWQAPPAEALRQVVPENRLRVYDTRAAMQGIADEGSLLALRTGFGVGIHTALARIAGRPVGLMANNPQHLGGAIDADAADKAARFMQLCNAHGLPIVSLVDTPGFMVGPETEAMAQVRHVSRMFVAAAHLRVPLLSVVLRKGYGLGAMAMTGGGFHETLATVAWPTGEFGGMGLEGAVRLGFGKQLEAIADPLQRQQVFENGRPVTPGEPADGRQRQASAVHHSQASAPPV